ncbi:MAG: LON peptidase substrate-binding domain-containing protein, partial [Acidobacteriales bacterium]|nr:LON peptidase substrate-binding domain-containing protein [Terriglobales bacterium]
MIETMNAENLNAELRGDQKPEASDAQASAEMRHFPRLPEHAIPIVPVRNLVLFPGIILPLTVGRKQSVAAAQEATRAERPIGVVLQRNAEAESPTPEDLHWVGTVASVVRYMTGRDGAHHLICQGEQRFRITQFIEGYPFLVGRIEHIEEPAQTSREIEARMLQLKERVVEALQLLPQPPEELGSALQGVQSASALADLSAHFMDLKPAEKQDILETFDVQARLDKVLAFLAHRLEVLRLSRDIGQRTKESMDERQREYLLREQLKAIQKELGETDQNAAEVAELS